MEKAVRSAPAEGSGAPVAAVSTERPAAGDPGGPDADGVRQYRIDLAREARRHKDYPARALASGVAGTVEVKVAVAAGGVPGEVRLGRSSGNGLLDDAALEMIRKAAVGTAVPESLRRAAFAVSLPVVFDLPSE